MNLRSRQMNFKLLNAEAEIRRGYWGPGIGGLQEEKGIIDLLKRIENHETDTVSDQNKERINGNKNS